MLVLKFTSFNLTDVRSQDIFKDPKDYSTMWFMGSFFDIDHYGIKKKYIKQFREFKTGQTFDYFGSTSVLDLIFTQQVPKLEILKKYVMAFYNVDDTCEIKYKGVQSSELAIYYAKVIQDSKWQIEAEIKKWNEKLERTKRARFSPEPSVSSLGSNSS